MAGTLRLNNTGTGNGQSTITTAATGDATYTLPSVGGTFLTTSGNVTLQFASGTVSAPSVTFVDDLDTGLYSPGANQLALSTNGTGRLFVNASGDVGLNTLTPTSIGANIRTLEIKGAATGRGGGIKLSTSDNSQRGSFYIYEGEGILGTETSHPLGLYTNNTERARIDSSGRLLVGTSSARSNFRNGSQSAQIQLEGTSADTSRLAIINNSNTDTGFLYFARSKGTTIGSNTVVTSGNYLGSIIFAGNDGSEFVDGASIDAIVDGTPGANDLPTRLVFSTTADGASSPTERMRINSSGHLTCTGTSSTNNLGTVSFTNSSASATRVMTVNIGNASGGELIVFDVNGVGKGSITTNGTTVAYNTSSDYRLKENVVLLTGATERLRNLVVHRFNFIADPSRTVDGFLAHEAQAVVPECVTGEKDAVDANGNPVYQGIDQSKLVPLLTAALQEAVAKIESLEARLTAAGI